MIDNWTPFRAWEMTTKLHKTLNVFFKILWKICCWKQSTRRHLRLANVDQKIMKLWRILAKRQFRKKTDRVLQPMTLWKFLNNACKILLFVVQKFLFLFRCKTYCFYWLGFKTQLAMIITTPYRSKVEQHSGNDILEFSFQSFLALLKQLLVLILLNFLVN